MLKLSLILIFVFSINSQIKEKNNFAEEGKEYDSISSYFSNLFNSLQMDSESIIYLVYQKKQLSENQNNVTYIFFMDFGIEKKFYIGIEAESISLIDLTVTNYVSSSDLTKVLNFLNVPIENVFKDNENINYANHLLKSDLKPNLCQVDNAKLLSQNPLIKKQQFFFDLNSLLVSKNSNYQSDEKKPNQIFINLPDNLTAHSIEITRTNINKKHSGLDQTNKNVLTDSQKNEIMNIINKEGKNNSLTSENFNNFFNDLIKKADQKYNSNSDQGQNKEYVQIGNIYNDASNQTSSKVVDNDFPRFSIESINRMQNPLIERTINQNEFPTNSDFETFKNGLRDFETQIQNFNVNKSQNGVSEINLENSKTDNITELNNPKTKLEEVHPEVKAPEEPKVIEAVLAENAVKDAEEVHPEVKAQEEPKVIEAVLAENAVKDAKEVHSEVKAQEEPKVIEAVLAENAVKDAEEVHSEVKAQEEPKVIEAVLGENAVKDAEEVHSEVKAQEEPILLVQAVHQQKEIQEPIGLQTEKNNNIRTELLNQFNFKQVD